MKPTFGFSEINDSSQDLPIWVDVWTVGGGDLAVYQ
jgi:hypothetical protein